jgi:hypothetical protein
MAPTSRPLPTSPTSRATLAAFRPKSTYRRVYRCADTAMSGASLHAARIARPLHGVDHRVQARVHQLSHVSSPLFSRLHDRLHLPITKRRLIVGSSCLSVGNIGQKMPPFSDSSYVCKSETRKCVASLRRDVSRDSRVARALARLRPRHRDLLATRESRPASHIL